MKIKIAKISNESDNVEWEILNKKVNNHLESSGLNVRVSFVTAPVTVNDQ